MADISEYSVVIYERKAGALARGHFPEGTR
jgi:hypothetical protein